MGEKGGLCENKNFNFFFLSWENMFQTAVLSSAGKTEEELRGRGGFRQQGWQGAAGNQAAQMIGLFYRQRG